MTMIQEDFVSFEIAELLREKGFPIERFNKGLIGMYKGISVSKITKEMIEKEILSCIPQSVVMKWLRKIHNLIITIDYDEYEMPFNKHKVGYGYNIQQTTNPTEFFKIGENVYNSYEEACEAAIKYCLTNLI